MRSVIYSADPEFLSAFHSATLGLNLQYQQAQNAADLLHICTATTIDLVVIDVDSVADGADMVALVKRESANRELVMFAASGKREPDSLIGIGASLALRKPVNIEIARRHLCDALLITDGERRQYNRVRVNGQMHLHSVSDGKIDGELVNIGEGGLALKLARVPKERSLVEIVFRLPGDTTEFRAPGKISWADPLGNVGIRFGALEPSARHRLSGFIAGAEKPADVRR